MGEEEKNPAQLRTKSRWWLYLCVRERVRPRVNEFSGDGLRLKAERALKRSTYTSGELRSPSHTFLTPVIFSFTFLPIPLRSRWSARSRLSLVSVFVVINRKGDRFAHSHRSHLANCASTMFLFRLVRFERPYRRASITPSQPPAYPRSTHTFISREANGSRTGN